MKTYTESKPVFSEEIPVTEPTDPAHADNINAAPKQLLQNTLVNHASIQELEKGNQMVEFEDYSSEGTDVPDPEAAVSQVSSGKADKVFRQYVKASLKGLLNLAQRALNVAMGKNQARVFATVAALDAWLAVPANVQQLNAGDHFYIVDTDVPDYWWDGKQKQVLEAQKVDLTTYDQRISELYGNISKVFSSRTIPDNDVNRCLENGAYVIGGDVKNAPTGYGYGVLAVFRCGTYILQIVKSVVVSDGFLYVRTCDITGNVERWSPWRRLVLSDV